MASKPRGVLLAGNWKMNHGPAETGGFFGELGARWTQALSTPTIRALQSGSLRACVFPPAVSLQTAASLASSHGVCVGAQNAHWERKGAYTGEIAGPMLQELGVEYALVAHSERRQLFGETDELACRRACSLLDQGFRVVLCVGETRSEREAGRTQEVLRRQLEGGLFAEADHVRPFLDGQLVLAYEPVWAIGTGLTASPAQAEEAHQFLRKLLWDRFGMEASAKTPILYGGSVTPENVASLLACANIDGALVGGASLKPDSFLALVEAGGAALR